MLDDKTAKRVTFDFSINVSHIVVAVGALLTAAWFIIGIQADLKATSADLRQMIIELRAQNTIQDQQIVQLRSDSASSRLEESTFRSEMRTQTSELSKLLNDIRIQAARYEDGRGRR